MLRIRFGVVEPLIRHTSDQFYLVSERKWTDNEMVRDIIRDIDKTEVITGSALESSVLGPISLMEISGGAKLLIMTLMMPEYNYTGSAAGDNCNNWFLKIGSLQDITLCYYHLPKYEGDFEILILNDNSIVRNGVEFLRAYGRFEEEMYHEWDIYASNQK